MDVGTDLLSVPSVGLSACRSVGQSVRRVYCDSTWMLFGVVSGVGRGMGALDGVEIVEGEEKGQFWGKRGALWRSYSLL